MRTGAVVPCLLLGVYHLQSAPLVPLKDLLRPQNNIALGDPTELRHPLSSITLTGCAYLGGGQPDSWGSTEGYAGAHRICPAAIPIAV